MSHAESESRMQYYDKVKKSESCDDHLVTVVLKSSDFLTLSEYCISDQNAGLAENHANNHCDRDVSLCLQRTKVQFLEKNLACVCDIFTKNLC